jgi:pimeloyl-ACP methyl ester carboxylesterase
VLPREEYEEEHLLGAINIPLKALNLPVLVLHGSEDPRPAWAVDSIVGALPAAELHVLPDVGQVPWLEGSENCVAVLQHSLAPAP